MDPAFTSLCVRRLDVPAHNPPQQVPLYLSSSFLFEEAGNSVDVFAGQAEGFVYSRYGNPTIDAVALRQAEMEGYGLPDTPVAYMTSSGMAAIHVLLLGLLPQGGKVLTQSDLYGGTTELFNTVLGGLGIVPVFTDLDDPSAVEAILVADPGIRIVYMESPSNPLLHCLDLEALAAVCHRQGRLCVADNTFCTPYVQRPLSLGVDFVIHSTTKYLNGHGTGIAGVIIGRDQSIMKQRVCPVLKLTGATCNPFDAWMVANGIRTLPLRMDRHQENALALATWLSGHAGVNRVNYPGLPGHPSHAVASRQMRGFGGMLSFEVPGGREGALGVMNRLKIPSIAPTLGDVDTLILHPASSSHLRVPPAMRESKGITEGLIRVSVGLEDIGELIADFSQALASG